jgi:hypothetical protein
MLLEMFYTMFEFLCIFYRIKFINKTSEAFLARKAMPSWARVNANYLCLNGGMVDTLASEASALQRGGSSPL